MLGFLLIYLLNSNIATKKTLPYKNVFSLVVGSFSFRPNNEKLHVVFQNDDWFEKFSYYCETFNTYTQVLLLGLYGIRIFVYYHNHNDKSIWMFYQLYTGGLGFIDENAGDDRYSKILIVFPIN